MKKYDAIPDSVPMDTKGGNLTALGQETYEDLLAEYPPGIDRDRNVWTLG